MPASSPPLVLLVGMHRSGTSLLGSMLPACGVAMPGPLLPGDSHNPEGYFEHAAITALQEQLLIDLERWWPSPRGMQPLPSGWLDSHPGQAALRRLVDLLAHERAQQTGAWAIKDPRSSLLLPLWRAACTELELPLRLVLAVRDPAEVVVSLVQRDQTSTGMDAWRAQRLWWHHNQQVLIEGEDLPLQVVSYSHWFQPSTARQQLRQLQPQLSAEQIEAALSSVRIEHRRSHRQTPSIPIAQPLQQLQQRLERLALTGKPHQPAARARLTHWLEHQAEPAGLAPLPRRRSTIKRALLTRLGRPPLSRVSVHPWGYLAQIACGSEGPAAEHQLSHWLQHGFRLEELERFAALPGPAPSAEAWRGEGSAIQLHGCEASTWACHAWLQHCPLTHNGPLSLVPLGHSGGAPVALNLGPITPGPEGGQQLLKLAALERVWDPDRQRVQQLRQFGVRASWLQPHAGARNPHLAGSEERWAACASELGLPHPQALTGLGHSLCLGNSSPLPAPPLLGLPGFDDIRIDTPEQAHLLACWLQGCLEVGLELVRFNVSPAEQALMAWQALWQPPDQNKAPLLLPHEPMEAEELLEQLAWHRQGCPPHAPCHTPQPAAQVIWERRPQGAKPPDIAVCVSLYNYSGRVLSALESVRLQRQAPAIELIVVDDASSDDGAAQVQAWMTEHGHSFVRCVLLQHTCNGGLASARNTAFSAAESPWCFVLDADNGIEPLALKQALTVAQAADNRCAVVHSLIRVQAEASSNDARALVSATPWQQAQLRHGNSIDAMALVRRSAWKAVGGYTHIPGGWEDYDFWCCLIESGWHGVLCPQVLATYTSHGGSMRSQTVSHTYRLSQLLQQRHPWLNIAQAADQTAGTGQRSNRGGQAST